MSLKNNALKLCILGTVSKEFKVKENILEHSFIGILQRASKRDSGVKIQDFTITEKACIKSLRQKMASGPRRKVYNTKIHNQ